MVIGDDSLLDKAKRPTAVVYRREDVAELASQEIIRLLSEERRGTRPSWSTPNWSSKAKPSPNFKPH